MKYDLHLENSSLVYETIEAPFAQMAVKILAEMKNLKDGTIITVRSEIGNQKFEVKKLEMYYIRPTFEPQDNKPYGLDFIG